MIREKFSKLVRGDMASSSGAAVPENFGASRPPNAQPIRNLSNYLSAMAPLPPIAPPGQYETRRYDYQIATNIDFTPGGGKYPILRGFANAWNLLRSVIDTKKDLVASVPWDIKPIPKPGETKKETIARAAQDPVVTQLRKFFQSPNGEDTWYNWVRKFLEEVYVIDAGSLRVWRDKSGKIASIDPIAGDTIFRVIDDHGRTPCEKDANGEWPVAYQQVVSGGGAGSGGVPQENLTVRDLIFMMRNPRPDQKWGQSSVEKIYKYASIGMQADEFVLQYFTSGNQPPGIAFLPDMTPDQVSEFDKKFNAAQAGDLANRRRIAFLPSGFTDKNPQFIATKEPLLKTDIYDDMVRFLCYEFSVSAQNLQRPMSRASAESGADQAEAEGLQPDLTWLGQIMNRVIQEPIYFNLPGYEFVFGPRRDIDPLKQMQVDTGYQAHGVLTINEVREELGKTPFDKIPEADEPGVLTPNNGFIPLEMAKNPMLPSPTSGATGGKPASKQQPGAAKAQEQAAAKPKLRNVRAKSYV